MKRTKPNLGIYRTQAEAAEAAGISAQRFGFLLKRGMTVAEIIESRAGKPRLPGGKPKKPAGRFESRAALVQASGLSKSHVIGLLNRGVDPEEIAAGTYEKRPDGRPSAGPVGGYPNRRAFARAVGLSYSYLNKLLRRGVTPEEIKSGIYTPDR